MYYYFHPESDFLWSQDLDEGDIGPDGLSQKVDKEEAVQIAKDLGIKKIEHLTLMQEEGLKVLKAEITNFKNITHKEVNFEGRSAIIIGPNGAGKSSLIQAVCSPINSKVLPAQPVKKGEEKASVELTIGGLVSGELQTYNVGMYFSEKDKRGRIVITDAEGSKVPGGKKVISSIVGNIGFDIVEFLRMGKTGDGKVSAAGIKKQIEVLKSLLPQETIVKLHDIDVERKEAYEERGTINKEITYLKGRLENHDLTAEEIETYSKKKDPKPVEDKIEGIAAGLEKYTRAKSAEEKYGQEVVKREADIEKLKADLIFAEEDLKRAKLDLSKTSAWLEKNEEPDFGKLNDELKEINEHNGICDEVAKLEASQKEISDKETKAEELTEKMAELDEDKKKLFKETPLPVKDLEFDEDQILYKGLPFQEGQHPSSTMIGIGTRIGMAMNPNLRLLIIRDGSLLDKKMMKFILKICDQENYQVLIERVADEGKEVEVEFTES